MWVVVIQTGHEDGLIVSPVEEVRNFGFLALLPFIPSICRDQAAARFPSLAEVGLV